ncbi:MAG: substrate-binding domain-containing protein [Spirochaetes bacterium]|jgi:ribose transport system substrate-binding protein|nr:substrate-binding domain-containing protein [Spirochaetota bacterium]
MRINGMKGTALLIGLLLVAATAGAAGTEESDQLDIAVVTPYMANATTAQVINNFEAYAEAEGWRVNVSDTAGDFGMLVSRIQDAVTQNVDAIVLGMGDPAQMTAGLNAAVDAGIPVFGLDAGLTEGVYLNVTSDNADLGRKAAESLAEAVNEAGDIVLFTHDPHPGVRARAEGARAAFEQYPDIEIIREIHIEVPGPVDFARSATEDLLTSYSEPGSVAGIWAGWDEPAYGATQAIDRAERGELRVVGVDGTDFAVEEIDSGDVFAATVVQDFDAMARRLVELMSDYLAGDMPESRVYQIPGKVYE